MQYSCRERNVNAEKNSATYRGEIVEEGEYRARERRHCLHVDEYLRLLALHSPSFTISSLCSCKLYCSGIFWVNYSNSQLDLCCKLIWVVISRMEIKDLLKFVQLAGTHPAFLLEKIIELAD